MNNPELTDDEAAWNAKVKIAEAVVPILQSYKNLILSKNSFSIPSWVLNENEQLNEFEMANRWLSYLDSMITAFSLELNNDIMDEQKLKIQDNGLYLFAKYYHHLWD